MPRTTDWRSQHAVDALLELDRAGLAWEFLRRNPDYREDFRQTLQRHRLTRDLRRGCNDGVLPSLGGILSPAIPTCRRTRARRSGGPS